MARIQTSTGKYQYSSYSYGQNSETRKLQDLCDILNRGDRKLDQCHPNAIVLIGPEGTGKTTVYDWVRKKPMVGKGSITTTYVPISHQDNISGFDKLAPNVFRDFETQLSLADMAGYGVNNNYVKAVGVPYFFQSLFQKVSRAKFVIVVNQNTIVGQLGIRLVRSFQMFAKMFKTELITEQIIQKLRKSVSLLFTKGIESKQYYREYMTQVIQDMEDPSFQVENKKLVKQLLTAVYSFDRLQIFKAAKENKNPEECTFIHQFNKNGWQFFESRNSMGSSLIHIPMQDEFQKLMQKQKQKFRQQMWQKVDGFLGFPYIFGALISDLYESWHHFLNVWQRERIFNFNNFRFNEFFGEVRRFVNYNDVYCSNEFVEVYQKVNYETPNFINSLKSILKVQQLVEIISCVSRVQQVLRHVVDPQTGEVIIQQQLLWLGFKEILQKLMVYFAEIIKISKRFASSRDEEILLQRAKFILNRGFKEFQKLYCLNPCTIHSIQVKLQGNCGSAFVRRTYQLKEYFIYQLDENLLLRLFPSINTFQQYQIFINEYFRQERQFRNQIQRAKFQMLWSVIQLTKETAKIYLSFSQMSKEQSLRSSLTLYTNIQRISTNLAKTQLLDESQRARELNTLQSKKLKLLGKILQMVQASTSAGVKDWIIHILELAQYQNLLEETRTIYQLINNSAQERKARLLSQYANYCNKQVLLSQYIRLLGQKITADIQRDSKSFDLAEVNQMITKKQRQLALSQQIIKKIKSLKVVNPSAQHYFQELQRDFRMLLGIADEQSK